MQGAFWSRLKMTLRFRLKSKTPVLAGRSTEGSTWPSHFKHNGCLNLNLTQTHWVTCHSVSHSPQRQLVEMGRSELGLAKAINCFYLFTSGCWRKAFHIPNWSLWTFLHQASNVKTKWEWNTEKKKNWSVTAMWKQTTFKNLLRKKGIAASTMSILIRILSVRNLNS